MTLHSNIPMRKDTANHYRSIRKILRGNPPEIPSPALMEDEKMMFSASMLFIYLLMAGLMFVASCIHPNRAFAYTDEQYVNAIYKAEGGLNAQYPYGIRSVRIKSIQNARRICFNTVRNNRKRWGKCQRPRMAFISYLGSKYCPTKGVSLSNTEKEFNQYWVKNVSLFLEKDNV